MARRQDPARGGGAGGELTERSLAVLVQHRLEAEAALALAAEEGLAIELVMAAGIAGPAVIKAIEELLGQPITVLCDDRPGLALEALRIGLRLQHQPTVTELQRCGSPTSPGSRAATSVSACPSRFTF